MALPLSLTGVLVLTTVPLVLAVVAARRGRLRRHVGADRARAGRPGRLPGRGRSSSTRTTSGSSRRDDTAYGSIYFTLLGAHHAHVAFGLLLDLWILVRLTAGLTNYRLITVQAVALYWAFVNLLAILVVATQVSPA